MGEDRKMLEQNFTGVDLKICPADYHDWVFPIIVLEDLLQGGLSGIAKW